MNLPTLEEVRAELARREFSRFLPWSTPSWRWEWPHLAKMQEVLQALADDEIQNALFMVPPQHGKTEQNTIRFSCWLLHRDLSTRVALAAYNQELANRFSRSARRLATEIGIPLIGDRAAVQEWQTDQGGGVRAVGIGAGLTGNPVDIGIIDDPIKDREEAEARDRLFGQMHVSVRQKLARPLACGVWTDGRADIQLFTERRDFAVAVDAA